jgi:hypothetical protein
MVTGQYIIYATVKNILKSGKKSWKKELGKMYKAMTERQAWAIYCLLHCGSDIAFSSRKEDLDFAFKHVKYFDLKPLDFKEWISDQGINLKEGRHAGKN